MNENLSKVAEFHKTFGQPILNPREIPEINRRLLRLSLILEELGELAEAMGMEKNYREMLLSAEQKLIGKESTFEFDRIKVVDALGDLEYVVHGASLECGVSNVINKCFDEIHSSNMSKACRTDWEAQDLIDKLSADGVNAYYEEVDGKFVVYRSHDKKVIKGANYKEPQLSSLVLP